MTSLEIYINVRIILALCVLPVINPCSALGQGAFAPASVSYHTICFGNTEAHPALKSTWKYLEAEAQKPKTFLIAAIHAQKLSGRSARIHFAATRQKNA